MMRDAFVNWRRATENLLVLMEEKDEEKRDEIIEKVDQLLTVRDQLQTEMAPPFTKEEEAFGKELIELETVLQTRLKTYTENIRREITVSQSKKSNMKSYVNPYQNIMRDGAYYDTKQ